MTETIGAVTQDRALKARHRAMWALGDYPTVASEVIPELGPVLVTATGVDSERVAALDHDLAALAARYDHGTAGTVPDWEYLLLMACRV